LRLIYSIGIYIASFVIKLLALFNVKLKHGVLGRKNTFKILENYINKDDKTFWFHCASLGEYEQGLPVFEALKAKHPNYKVVLTFFSPSGYEVRKNTKIADFVTYLPLDTKTNAKRFLDLINPDYIIFVKYEIWPNFLLEIKKRQLKAILISAVFRKNQSFFKWYGGWFKKQLKNIKWFFVQNEDSKGLLNSIGITNVKVSGDTRFDRVNKIASQKKNFPLIEKFASGHKVLLAGSSWPSDEKLLVGFINVARQA